MRTAVATGLPLAALGAGLGWQLMEALSSFYWPLVAWLVMVYAALTLLGELVCERLQEAA